MRDPTQKEPSESGNPPSSSWHTYVNVPQISYAQLDLKSPSLNPSGQPLIVKMQCTNDYSQLDFEKTTVVQILRENREKEKKQEQHYEHAYAQKEITEHFIQCMHVWSLNP